MTEASGARGRRRIQVLGRQWCHLCHDMEVALRPIAAEFGLDLETVDVDMDPELEARWDEWVPVLLVDGEYVCHYHLDEIRLRALLISFPVHSGR
ncbi:MAG: glutaredoxin family protein [Zoogloeaceae bacterium]|nr:glutaredoxin family protein [Zoogloeaceae bacterium]